jgi:hypothetical protein
MDTPRLCKCCMRRGDLHRISDGHCPPDRTIEFPRLALLDEDQIDPAIAAYWNAGPDSTWNPLT